MTTADRVVADLVTALDTIIQEIDRPNTRVPFIYGVATQAITNCDIHRERNADGYMTLKAATPPAGTPAGTLSALILLHGFVTDLLNSNPRILGRAVIQDYDRMNRAMMESGAVLAELAKQTTGASS